MNLGFFLNLAYLSVKFGDFGDLGSSVGLG